MIRNVTLRVQDDRGIQIGITEDVDVVLRDSLWHAESSGPAGRLSAVGASHDGAIINWLKARLGIVELQSP